MILLQKKFRVKQKKNFLKFRSRKEAFVLILKCTTAKKIVWCTLIKKNPTQNEQTKYFFVPILIPGCSPKKLFSCQLCGKVLCSKASLKRHIADKHAERQEEYRCIICERVYCSRNSLMTHIYTYHKSRPGELEMKDIKFF